MTRTLFLTFLLFVAVRIMLAQTLLVKPYLQDAFPDKMTIKWETDVMDASTVHYGMTEALGSSFTGTVEASGGNTWIHEVTLTGLNRFTTYYYQVNSGSVQSDIFHFKTPPFASDHQSTRIALMSDMQQDSDHPGKFQEIIEEGIIDYLNETVGGDITDNLALVMIPGDLVQDGNNFNSWRTTFFNPAEKLSAQVPFYPVLGNHENNTTYYFTYFKLPDNGSAGFEEHWWHKDYGNVRIIGLNSNAPFTNQTQIDWLEDLLDETCQADSIDFVFAQLHHPYKSELWTPGELDYTGEVVKLMEDFTHQCGKPSIHFFGHTHGYSRGQSRDHKHLWINVASAGGAIDNWGEFPNFDYDQFSVSQDEYGFVLVEVTDDADPKIVVKRISRGDQDVIVDNLVTDSLTIRLNPSTVNTPVAESPKNIEIAPECVVLKANEFSAPNSDAFHGQSHWQVTTPELGFNTPVAESWKNFENWYFDMNTQANDDLTNEKITGISPHTSYLWRVRYRDKEMNWSDWSDVAAFKTGASLSLPNLLLNGDAENEVSNWEIIEGVFESLEALECDGINPHGGVKYFSVGGLCEHSAVGRVAQTIDVQAMADSIDLGRFKAYFGGYLSNFAGSDRPEMKFVCLDESNAILSESDYLTTLNNTWTLVNEEMSIPPQTRFIQVELKGTRNVGTDNDSYFDDLFLKVGNEAIDCNPVSSANYSDYFITKLNVYPNPTNQKCNINLPEHITKAISVFLVDTAGNKYKPDYSINASVLNLNTGPLMPGLYSIFVWSENKMIGVGKFSVMR